MGIEANRTVVSSTEKAEKQRKMAKSKATVKQTAVARRKARESNNVYRPMVTLSKTMPVFNGTKPHIMTAESRAVVSIDDSWTSATRFLAKGVYIDGALVGFGNYDGNIVGLMTPYRWFRVAKMRFDLVMTCGTQKTARVALGFNPGTGFTNSEGPTLDNEHAIMVSSGQPSATLVMGRSDICPEPERWFNATTQSVITQTIAAASITSLVPSREDLLPGSFTVVSTKGDATGGIATLIVTTTLELTSYT